MRRIGKAKRRAAPKVVNHVNRNLESLTIALVVKLVLEGPQPWEMNKRGRKPIDPKIVAICCLLKVFLSKTYDEIESYYKVNTELARLLKTTNLPGHSVIHRGMEKLTLPYLRRFSRRLLLRFKRQGMIVAVDSTGFSLSKTSKWFDIRVRRENQKRDFLKLHVAIDVDTGLIQAFSVSAWKVADTTEFKHLLKALPRIGKCLGDKGYSSRVNCTLVLKKGGMPYLMFKSNAAGKAKGHPAWKRSFQEYKQNEKQWLQEYHLRSLVESIFSSIKKRWSGFIQSKNGWMMIKELSLKVVSYNIKQVLYLEHAVKIGTTFRISVE